ncbi:MAG: trehalase-like domain-containing protein, partial [Xanthomonadales bacterium]|nr:trehalase-like domain-containing protein [Xanthomonadales bacterium]
MQSTKVGPRYPAIEDYAVIGDCRTAALISRQGSLDWLCLPHFSGGAIFSALLDQRIGGRFAITSSEPAHDISRRYVGETNVLETTFGIVGGRFRVTDFMPVLSGAEWEDTLQPQRELLRIIECMD